MKLYRGMDINELNFQADGIWVMPKPFKVNGDSTIPEGVWSFWHDQPLRVGQCLVCAQFTPELKGVMSFDQTHEFYGGEETYYYNIDEYVTSIPIKVDSIYIDSIYILEHHISSIYKSLFSYKGEKWIKENITDIFPYLKEGEYYSWGIACGQRPVSCLLEVISYTSYNFIMDAQLKYNHYKKLDYKVISTQLLTQKYNIEYKGDYDELPFYSDVASLIKQNYFEYPQSDYDE